METGGAGQDRHLAEEKFQQAQHERERGHQDRAEEMAKEALEFDRSFNAVRLWLADLYMQQGEEHLASRVLQDAVYTDRNDQEAWGKLRQIDPATAARLDRLGHIAPDPFVAARAAGSSEEFDSFDEVGPEEPTEASWLPTHDAADIFAGEEEAPAQAGSAAEQAPASAATGAEPRSAAATAAPAPAAPQRPGDARGPAPWDYEQDRQYLTRWQQEAVVQRLVAGLQELWHSHLEPLLPVINMCAHLERSRHPEIVDAAHHCCAVLGVGDPELMVFPERCMHPVPIMDGPARLAIPTGLIRGMKGAEVVFQIGREVEYIRSGYLAEWQVAALVAKRPTRLVGDVATALFELLHDLLASIEATISREARPNLVKLAHAWQQRATLTADRAGWLCCGDVNAACRAIAKTTAPSLEKAAATTLEGFLEQFKDKDPAQLAAIPPTETPDRSVPYAAYRIKMLRWWANTPEAKRLSEQMASVAWGRLE
jgi:hypothetical protein